MSYLWHLPVLVVLISLVYGATRHELMMPILAHGLRFGGWVVGFMVVLFLILLGVGWLV
jgi:hypothetical protein